MMILQKRTVPVDIQEYNKMSQEYHDNIHWRLVKHRDRAAKYKVDDKASQKAKEKLYGLGSSLKVAQDQAARKLYDDATGEVEIVPEELMKYLICAALKLIRRETDSLTKAYEMSNIKMQAHIHPVQQFASTFEMKVDSRNHLDIINKVPAI